MSGSQDGTECLERDPTQPEGTHAKINKICGTYKKTIENSLETIAVSLTSEIEEQMTKTRKMQPWGTRTRPTTWSKWAIEVRFNKDH